MCVYTCGCLPVYMLVHHVHAVVGATKDTRFLELELQKTENHPVSPVEEQQMLLTSEPPLQSLNGIIINL